MKHFYAKLFITVLLLATTPFSFSQTLEDFEDETAAATTFTSIGQTFTISSSTGEDYNIFQNGFTDGGSVDNCANCGWNGTNADGQFIDNTANSNGANNGSSFTITTNSGEDINIIDLYLFCSTLSITQHSGTLNIEGRKDGNYAFDFDFTNFADPTDFSAGNNAGFSYIDFSNQNGNDYTDDAIDELIFTSTGNLDYMALDGLTWQVAVLSTDSFVEAALSLGLFPNPTTSEINIKNLQNDSNYSIIDLLGKTVKQGQVTRSNPKIDVQSMAEGIYLLRLESGQTLRFVKQ